MSVNFGSTAAFVPGNALYYSLVYTCFDHAGKTAMPQKMKMVDFA
jgi:hypothetical protein